MRRFGTTLFMTMGLVLAMVGPAVATTPGGNGVIVFDRSSGEDDGQPPRIMTVTPDVSQFATPVDEGRDGAISPNGRLLAYDVPIPIGASRLVVARADGSGARSLTDGNVPIYGSPAWSPDGTRLVTSAGRGMALIDVATGDVERTMLEDCSVGDPTWSPVTNRIAASVNCDTGAGRAIYTLRPDGTDLQQVTTDPDPDDTTQVRDGAPTWSPDGERLAFQRVTSVPLSDQPSVGRVMVVDADGADARALTDGEVFDSSPVWSPDGSEIMFARAWDGDGARIFGIGPDGDGLRNLTIPPSPIRHVPTDWESVASVDAACPEGAVPAAGFDDVGGTHEPSIDCAVWHGLAHGRPETTYAPSAPVQRDQMASFLARLLEGAGVELPAPSSQGFTDIAGNTHADAINQLAELDVIAGVDATTYAPARALTRAQMASLLVRAVEHVEAAPLDRVFDEFVDDDGSVHEPAVERAALAGLTSGVSASRYESGASVTRGQLASFLTRTVDRFVRDGRMELPQ